MRTQSARAVAGELDDGRARPSAVATAAPGDCAAPVLRAEPLDKPN
ncbi:hypothetical protein [uncultured Sphingomonas sp.]